jgi:hypothetical protein
VAKTTKDPVLIVVFSLGAILGLIGWSAIPQALFTLGPNDSTLSLLLAVLCLFLFMPLCFLAFWKLRLAGYCFLLLTVVWTTSIIVQCLFEKSRGHAWAANEFGALVYSAGFLFFGVFALRADRRQSMSVQPSKQSSETKLL